MVQDMIKGVGVALITPFNNYKVDYDSLGRMVDYVIAGGVDYIVALGSTAETALRGHHLQCSGRYQTHSW